MKSQVMTTVITRENWEQFCEEPNLSKDEWALWNTVKEHARANPEFFDFLFEDNGFEQEPGIRTGPSVPSGDWSDLAEWADWHRRYVRANIVLWEKYCATEEGETP